MHIGDRGDVEGTRLIVTKFSSICKRPGSFRERSRGQVVLEQDQGWDGGGGGGGGRRGALSSCDC